MYITADHAGVCVHAPAKVNLHLEVCARRPDGFHDLEMLMAAVACCDTLRLEPRPGPEIRLACRWRLGMRSGAALPRPEENLAYRALVRLQHAAGCRQGAEVWLAKSIPAQAGLGGGSSDAAAALIAANQAWGLHWPLARLADLSLELGSDIPFFFAVGAAVCRGRGEQVEPARLPPLFVVGVKPPVGLATAEVFRLTRPGQPPAELRSRRSALQGGDWSRLALHNRLQGPAEQLTPWIGRLNRAFAGEPCLLHQMTGSGSCYFGLYRSASLARRSAARLRAQRLGEVFVGAAPVRLAGVARMPHQRQEALHSGAA